MPDSQVRPAEVLTLPKGNPLGKLAHVLVLVSCFRTSQRAFKPLGSFPMAFLIQNRVRISKHPTGLRLWPFQIQTSQRSVDLDAVGQCHGPFGLQPTPLDCLNFRRSSGQSLDIVSSEVQVPGFWGFEESLPDCSFARAARRLERITSTNTNSSNRNSDPEHQVCAHVRL